MLVTNELVSGYGSGPDVLLNVSVDVRAGEFVSLVGLNGAGKSTLVKTIVGLLPTRSGSITFEGQDISQLSTDARTRLGIILVPEGRELCLPMSVEENLLMGTFPLERSERKTLTAENFEKVYELFPILKEKRKDDASSLSGGQQQMVAVGRALMSSPRFLILDEPSLGLAPLLVREIFEAVNQLNTEGLSVLVVEQNAALAMKYSDRSYHLELGKANETESSQEERALMRTVLEAKSMEYAQEIELPAYTDAIKLTDIRQAQLKRRAKRR